MRNIGIVVLNLLLAAVITSPLCAQQFEEPPSSDGIGCFEDQPTDSYVSAMKPLRQGETVTVDLGYKQTVIFASDSAGTALAASEPLQMEISPSGARYDFDRRKGEQRMDITDLLRYGSNDIHLTAANKQQTYWLITYSPCAKPTKAVQASEARLLGINNVGDVSRNIFEILESLQLPESGTNQTATSATVAPVKVAARPTATAMPTVTPTVEPTPYPAAIATVRPQAVVMVPPTATLSPIVETVAQPVDASQNDAVLMAVTELNATVQRVLRMMQMSLLLIALLIALLLGWRHRTTIVTTAESVVTSKIARRIVAECSQLCASVYESVIAQLTTFVKQVRRVMRQITE